ncbi:MAG: hypothetical protein F4X62_21595 [Caldilineaceae bacterium SB0662_bin_25]|nr:hypothetical protein [Caldilineaceae bacterium SB0662_bin_25]
MNLEELKQKRLNLVEASRENGFEEGIGRLLTDLYPDNAHFIYELLQNAEDAQAEEVRFVLQEKRVEFEHDGDSLFSIEDVEAITGLGISTKKDEPTNIGKFGVGFKAVFAYTATPEISSGAFHFRIRDLFVPDTEGLPPRTIGEKGTRFSFPFDNPRKPPKTAYAEIEKNLRQLDESTLLFLGNIRKIEYLLPDSTQGFLERRKTGRNRIEILVQHPEKSEPVSVPYLLFEKEVDVTDEDGNLKRCRIAIAFGLEKTQKEEWQVKPVKNGQVCIYFPAEKETSNLRFHLHAPFASTVARDSVRECEANDSLRVQLAALVAESMTIIREQGLLNVGFLAVLPNAKDNLPPFYRPIMDRLVEAFQNEKLTPMKQGGHSAANGIFRDTGRLSNLISDSDLATILGRNCALQLWIALPQSSQRRNERGEFVQATKAQYRNERVRDFQNMLDVTEWTISDFMEVLKTKTDTVTEWMKGKSNGWHQDLYSLLGDSLSVHKHILLNLRIVRCNDETYRIGQECFFSSDDLNENTTSATTATEIASQIVFDEDVEYLDALPRVSKDVYSSGRSRNQQEKARAFLEGIGVSEVGPAEWVRAVLKQRYTEPFQPRVEDMERFLAFAEDEPDKLSLFKDYPIFRIDKTLDNKNWWGSHQSVFLDSPYLATGLTTYYEALREETSHKWVLSSEYKESGIEPERIGKFAKALGAQSKLTPKKQEIPHEKWLSMARQDTGGWSERYGINEDYDIPEFDTLLAEPDLTKSRLIWNTMNEMPECCLIAKYRSNSWYYPSSDNSILVDKLRHNNWVPQTQGGQDTVYFVKPSEAEVELLPRGFSYEHQSSWLKAIEFGKSKREREEAERRREQQATEEYRSKNDVVKGIGFSSVEEAEEMAKISREDPEFIARWKAEKQKPEFPEKTSQNPERRRKQLAEQYANAPQKKYEKRLRSVRTSRPSIDPCTWLRNLYKNDSDQMICQICKDEMPFRKRDGEHYFEAVEALSSKYFDEEHEVPFLALCPLCAAMYQEFVKRDEEQEAKLHHALQNMEKSEVPVTLGEWETSVRFVERHWLDMKTVLNVYQE